MSYITRSAERTVQRLATSMPVIGIVGPRQSGKTTLARRVFSDKPYLSLENLDTRDEATHDPRGFLAGLPEGAVLDEVQRAPGLFNYLQQVVDEAARPGLFCLTGSQQFDLLAGVTQTLSGRIGLVRLPPLSLEELTAAGHRHASAVEAIFRGGFPRLYETDLDPSRWLDDYVTTYVERDVRRLSQIRDLDSFRRFVRLAALRSARLVNLTELARDSGVSVNTAKGWLSVMEASFLVVRLAPWFGNLGKRLVKTSKLYFTDAGLAANLLGLESPEQVAGSPLLGHLFETLVITELLKARWGQGRRENLYFWRDHQGTEIDALCDFGTELRGVEIKTSQTPAASWTAGLNWLGSAVGARRDTGVSTVRKYIVYGGAERRPYAGAELVGWREAGSVMVDAAGAA